MSEMNRLNHKAKQELVLRRASLPLEMVNNFVYRFERLGCDAQRCGTLMAYSRERWRLRSMH